MKRLLLFCIVGASFEMMVASDFVLKRQSEIVKAYLTGDFYDITDAELKRHLKANFSSLSDEDRFFVQRVIERARELQGLELLQGSRAKEFASGASSSGQGVESAVAPAPVAPAPVDLGFLGSLYSWWTGSSSTQTAPDTAATVPAVEATSSEGVDGDDQEDVLGGAAGGGGAAQSPEDLEKECVNYFVNGEGRDEVLKADGKFTEVFNRKTQECGIESAAKKQTLVKKINDARRARS